MKKNAVVEIKAYIIAVILLALVVCLFMAVASIAQPLVKKYWQDVIRKPNQTWIQQYGYNNESILAFNVRSLLEVQNRMAQEVVALTAKVEALETTNQLGVSISAELTESPVDVNDPSDPNEVK